MTSDAAPVSWSYEGPTFEPRYWYSMYGMHVHSDFALPFPAVPQPTDIVPAWQFRLGNPGWSPLSSEGPPDAQMLCCCGPTRASLTVHRSDRGTLLQIPPYGRFCISPDGRRVDVWPELGIDEDGLGSVLAASVSVIVLQTLGYPTLHAMAFAFDEGAIAILSPDDQAFCVRHTALEQGGRLMTEEALTLLPRVGGIYAAPSAPLRNFRVSGGRCRTGRPQAVHSHGGCTEEETPRLAEATAPLRAVYVIGETDAAFGSECSAPRSMSPRDAVLALLQATSGRELMTPRDSARALQLYARLVSDVPVKLVDDPTAVDYRSAACSAS